MYKVSSCSFEVGLVPNVLIRKRLLSLKFTDKNGKEAEQRVSPGSEVISPGSEVISPASGKKIGNVTTALGSRGLGVLRLDEAFKHSGTLTIRGEDDVKVHSVKPEWWPSDWLQEHQGHGVAA